MTPRQFQVKRLSKENYDTFTLELQPANGQGESPFLPGQFNMIYVFGVGEVPISISGNPADPKVLVHTTRAVGIVTKALWKLKRGDVIGVRGPFGTHWPIEKAEGKDVVIVAGGIGLAPLRPALHALLADREKYGKILLLYGTRTPEDLLYQQDMKRWRTRFDLEVNVTVDVAMNGWRGNVGVVTMLIPRAGFDPHNTLVMVCGPEIMMHFTVLELEKRGVGLENIFISMERNMKCGIGLCGHCQFGPAFICKNGPVFRFTDIKEFFDKREL